MSKLEKLITRIKNNPKTVSYNELENLLLVYGFVIHNQKGSHVCFKKEGSMPLVLVKPHGNTKYVKKVYVQQVLKRLNLN